MPRQKEMKIHPQEPDRLQLAQLPTPVFQADRLAEHLRIERLYFKRDDLTGMETSGNKIRKLEYVAAHALQAGADTLVTLGAVQSNHCRATAATAARLGLNCRLLLRSDKTSPPPPSGNLLLDELFGAEISYHPPEEFDRGCEQMVERVMASLQTVGSNPFFIDMGASVPYGSWGYIRCVHELVDQLGADTPVDVYCATGSSGTQVGLMLGKALFGCAAWNIVGVPVCNDIAYFERKIRQLERDTVREFGLDVSEQMTPINLLDGFKGAGYGIPSPEAMDLIRSCARFAGLLLDPVYTSKALAGMLATIRANGLRRHAVPLFIHTGGVFGLLAQSNLFDQTAD
jgi:D-cysteine desulfhydrase